MKSNSTSDQIITKNVKKEHFNKDWNSHLVNLIEFIDPVFAWVSHFKSETSHIAVTSNRFIWQFFSCFRKNISATQVGRFDNARF